MHKRYCDSCRALMPEKLWSIPGLVVLTNGQTRDICLFLEQSTVLDLCHACIVTAIYRREPLTDENGYE